MVMVIIIIIILPGAWHENGNKPESNTPIDVRVKPFNAPLT